MAGGRFPLLPPQSNPCWGAWERRGVLAVEKKGAELCREESIASGTPESAWPGLLCPTAYMGSQEGGSGGIFFTNLFKFLDRPMHSDTLTAEAEISAKTDSVTTACLPELLRYCSMWFPRSPPFLTEPSCIAFILCPTYSFNFTLSSACITAPRKGQPVS